MKLRSLLSALALCSLPSALCYSQQFALDYRAGTTGIFTQKTITTGTNKLLGTLNGSDPVAITVGTGLSFSGTTLNATAGPPAWADITGKPTEFPPAAHNQAISTITGLQTSLDGKASLTGSYSNPAWITGLAWSKLSSVPAPVTTLGNLTDARGVLRNNGSGVFEWVDDLNINSLNVTPVDLGAGGQIAVWYRTAENQVFGSISLNASENGNINIFNHAANNYSNYMADCWEWWPNSGFHTEVAFIAPTADRALNFPDESGTLISTGGTGTVTNTMLAGSIALSKLAITGTPDGTKYLRDDGTWQTVSSGATTGANTFTGLQQFSGTTHAGLRLNNLTTTQRDAIGTPAAGMVVWNTTVSRIQAYNGSAWTAGMVRLDGDTMTGTLVLPAGTVSGPSLTFGDSTSGIYRSASGEVAITSGGTQRLRTTSTGLVATGVVTVGTATLQDLGSGQLSITGYGHYASAAGLYSTGVLRVSTAGNGGGNFVQIRPIAANTGLWENGSTAPAIYVANTYTNTTSYEAAGIRWSSNVAIFGPVKGSGGGSSRNAEFQTTETGVKWCSGSGSPESVVTAPVGSVYTRTDGGASTTLYVKESGSGNTGWIAK